MTEELGPGAEWEARARRYKAVHDGSPDGLMIFVALREPGGTIVDFEWLYSNASASRIVGRAAQDLVGKRLLVEMPGNKAAGLFEIYVRVVETGEPHAHELPYQRDGLDSWFRSTSTKLDDGFYVTFTDLTARKPAEEQLARLAAIVRSSEHAIYSTSSSGTVETWNGGAERLYGYTAAEIVGRSVDCLTPEAYLPARDAAVERVLVRGRVENFVTVRQTKAGDIVHVALLLSPITDFGGVTLGVAVVARDISEEMRLRERLAVADRMASIGTLAAGAAHEVNNPLTAVTGNLDVAIEDVREIAGGSPTGRLKELEAVMLEARAGADRIRLIIRGLMTFSGTDDDRRAVIEIKPVVELAIHLASTETRARARVVADYRETPQVVADGARLAQVFVHLIANAAQAIGDGDGDPLANGIHIVTSTDGSGSAVIEVHDSGPGISAAIIGRIFDPFFTTRPIGDGTGLGLSICRNIISGLGGEITARNRDERGATFRVVLPAAPSPRVTASPPAPPASRRGAVLVVDDEPSVGVILARVLRGHDVTVVTRAKDALALIAARNHFDVILSDLMMPEMSGMDFYDDLVLRHPEVAERVVFISGGVVLSGASEFLDRVPNERLGKPFDATAVRALVQRLVK